ncbi:MAG: AAA family ATPase, partial [Planctomycetota bacterium]
MIPRQLTLSGFLSYNERVTLNFSEIHLACISGLNGAGKSSILDAITWALFGQSRGKDSDDIINRQARQHKKKAEAEVCFEFQIGPNVYQVIRRKPLQKTTLLEFHMAVAGQPWKVLTESKIRQTQQAIETVLHLNYDSFISTNFFLQGKADEFAIKTPDKRKEILAELLGLHQWDSYKSVVSKRVKTTETFITVLSARIDQEGPR